MDQLLEGGFQNYKIYELCGLPGSGKTLFCYSVIRSYLTQFCNMVYYIDTKGDFNAMKFREMLEVEHLDDEVNDFSFFLQYIKLSVADSG